VKQIEAQADGGRPASDRDGAARRALARWSTVLAAALAAIAPAALHAGRSTLRPRPGQAEIVAAVRSCMQAPRTWSPAIRWFTTRCPSSPGSTAVVLRGRCYHGWTWSWGAIWVAERDDIHASALRHELVHSALIALERDPDPKHTGPHWAKCAGRSPPERGPLRHQ
jgi:hypothetical protein